jgi:hypothetical protein
MEPVLADVRLFVSVVSARQWPARFGESLANLGFHLGYSRLGGRLGGLRMCIARQAHPSMTRNDHLVQALAEGFTHFLSLDDDQTFPGDVVERMLAAEKPVVTCNYRKKVMEVEYVCSDIDGRMLDSTHRTGIERIRMMGMGMALIDLAALADVPAPYFGAIWNVDTGKYVIEDEFFCRLLWARGVEVWCDHDLSRQIGHVGEHEYMPPAYEPVLSLVEQAA